MSADAMARQTIDFFYSLYHELNDETARSLLLGEVNSSNAIEMYECEENKAGRPPLGLMTKMLHELAVKRHSEDLVVPERVCAALKNALPLILPSSTYGRHYWLTVLAGGSQGIKGRASQVIEEMAKRCKTFFLKSLFTDFPPCIAQFVVYFCEVDLLCAQTPVVPYDLPGRSEEKEEKESQRSTRARKDKNNNPLENFPLVLLLVMVLDESPRRGLSESGVLMVQKLIQHVRAWRRRDEWAHASTLQRALLCLLEAVRWHCAQAANSALTSAELRRVRAVESAGQRIQRDRGVGGAAAECADGRQMDRLERNADG